MSKNGSGTEIKPRFDFGTCGLASRTESFCSESTANRSFQAGSEQVRDSFGTENLKKTGFWGASENTRKRVSRLLSFAFFLPPVGGDTFGRGLHGSACPDPPRPAPILHMLSFLEKFHDVTFRHHGISRSLTTYVKLVRVGAGRDRSSPAKPPLKVSPHTGGKKNEKDSNLDTLFRVFSDAPQNPVFF